MKRKLPVIVFCALMALMYAFSLSACAKYEPKVIGITVQSQVEESYVDEFDYSNYAIIVAYDNGSSNSVALTSECLSLDDQAKTSIVGTHTLTVNYLEKTTTFSVTLKRHDFEDVVFEDKTVTYNGLPQTIEVDDLPDGASVSYSPQNAYTNVGEYEVTATITKEYYNDLTLTATLTITDIMRKITFVQSGYADIVKEVADGSSLDAENVPNPQQVNGYDVAWERTSFTNVRGDLTIGIIKTPKTYTITYVLNGGTNHIDNPTEYTIESPALPLYKPEKAIGATFAGWYTSSSFTDESKISEIKSGSFGDKTVYAKWLDYRIETADGFTINYNEQPALVSMTVPYATENIDLNSRFTVSKGCTWKLFADFTGSYEYPLKATTLGVGENKAYVIVFHPDGEHFTRYLLNIYRLDMKEYVFMNGLSVWKDGEIQERSMLSAPEKNPSKTGYDFSGWAVEENEVEFPYAVTKDVVFTALYTPIEYDIVYNLNGGNLETNRTKYTIEQYFTLDKPTRDYYTFDGWYNNAYYNDEAITKVSVGTYGKISLFAKWTPIEYTVTYELNGGENSLDNPENYNVETETITLSAPTRAGYTFVGWYTDSALKNNITKIENGSHRDITLYAVWQANENTLLFDGNGNTSGKTLPMKIRSDETTTLTANGFEKTGYAFIGWSTTKNGNVEYQDGASYTMGTESQYTLYAVWKANTNVLKFDGNGATSGETTQMSIDTDASKKLNKNGFTRDKYLFAGWSASPDGEVAYSDGASYTMGTDSEYTLYAVWTLNENEISFIGNGATSGEMENQTVYDNGNKVLNSNAFVKTGYHFIGWAESEDEEVVYTDGATATFVQKENYSLYAVWQANENTLLFDSNGNTSGETLPMKIRSDETTTLTANGFEKTGYAFIGWSTTKNGNVEYQDGEKYTMGTESQYTLYAVWKANTNVLKFDGNGATSGATSQMRIDTDDSKKLNKNGFTRDKYLFVGWSTAPDGEVAYSDCASYTMGTDSEYTLYAVWTLNENEITFIGNGATSGSMENQTVYNNGNKVLSGSAFVKTGYHFIGWAESEDGEVVYTDGATATFVQKENYSLYAVWQANENTLNFNGNGNTSGETSPMKIRSDETTTLTSNGFEKTGYTFIGWSTTQNGDVEYQDGASYTMGTESQYTLYAVWSLNENIIVFDGNGATSGTMDNLVVKKNENTTLLTNSFAKIGHHFIGWAESENGDVKYVDGATLNFEEKEIYTLYAVWEEGTEGLTYSLSNSEYTITGYTGIDTEVVIPSMYNGYPVVHIASRAFKDNTSLTSVTIGDSVTSIGEYAFYGCTNLTYNTYDNAKYLASSDNLYFALIKATPSYYITTCEINENCKVIASEAFYGCTGLTNIEIPDSVIDIGESAFLGCTGLTSIEVPKSVTSIGNDAFYNCRSLTSVTIGNGVTSIGAGAFENCRSLTSVTIPDSVTSIGYWAFSGCSGLTSIYYNATNCADLSFGNSVFYDAGEDGDGITVTIGNNVTKIPAYLFCPGSSSSYSPKITSVVFEENPSCTSIGKYAFYNCTILTNIEIPNSVTSIGSDAFYGCKGLTNIEIPDSVKIIGSSAFDDCKGLTSVYYTGTIDQWVQIEFSSYYSNPLRYAKNLYINNELVTEANITTATKINDYAFYDYESLTSVTIGNSVTSVGEWAFYGCTDLTTVYYKGTASDWENISVGSYNSYLTNATRYYYSETEPPIDSEGSAYDGNYWHYDENGNIVIWCKTENGD